jgi:hypothetical protein
MATTGSNEKTQPQKLLEEIIPRDENEKYPSDPEALTASPPWPTKAEQDEYWKRKMLEGDPKLEGEPKPPRKWSLARRKAYNAKKKASLEQQLTAAVIGSALPDIPPQEEPVAMIKFCPHCGKGLERFLA